MSQDSDCIFCKIINREIPSDIIYEDEDVLVFPDINPLTPVHLMVITRQHIPSLADMDDTDTPLVGKLIKAANRMAKEKGISAPGYRVTINSGAEAGQIVPHLHMHLMGGRNLHWEH
ncbi:MAG: histidine triad nucleotide-binding protein [Dehalococcoidales bacterium]|nr:histidine triad nucleotide-binding protein [Dehalococcoidales bacterium]